MTSNALPRVSCAADYVGLAAQVLNPATLAYLQGGSGLDVTARRNQEVLEQLSLLPRVLRTPRTPTLGVQLLGQWFDHPVFVAPVAHQRLFHPDAELATAQGAAAMQACMVASALSSHTLEDIADCTTGPKWFQLYPQATWADTLALLERAEAAAYGAVVLTADARVQQPSRSALEAGFQWPVHCVPANTLGFQQGPALPVDEAFVSRVRDHTRLPLLIKGVLHPQDAVRARALGASGVVVSNHGGRTVDGVCASASALAQVRRAVGDDYLVLFDGGVLGGQSVFKALAMGADAVLLGRLCMHGLAVAGALGVGHVLKLVLQELALAMEVCGCDSIEEIDMTHLAGE